MLVYIPYMDPMGNDAEQGKPGHSLYHPLFVFECLASVDSVGGKSVEC